MYGWIPYSLLPFVLAGIALFHRHRRAVVRERLERVARRRGGRVAKAPWYLYPRLVVPLERAETQLLGIHGTASGSATRTVAWTGCAEYPELTVDICRKSARVGPLERIGWQRAETGERAFDKAFWIAKDQVNASRRVLAPDVRKALLALDDDLRAHLRVGRAPAFRAGRQVVGETEIRLDVSIRELPASVTNVEALLDVVIAAHAQLLLAAERRSA